MNDDLYCLYYELESGGSVNRGPKDALIREATLMTESYPDCYVEVFRVKDHRIVFRHDNSGDPLAQITL